MVTKEASGAEGQLTPAQIKRQRGLDPPWHDGPRTTQLVWGTGFGARLALISFHSSHQFRGYMDFHELFLRLSDS